MHPNTTVKHLRDNSQRHSEQRLNSQRTEPRIEVKLREAERALNFAKAEMEQKSGAKGLAGGASAVLANATINRCEASSERWPNSALPKTALMRWPSPPLSGPVWHPWSLKPIKTLPTPFAGLAENRAGRATFLPINKLSSSRAGGKTVMTARKDGVLGFAHEMLDYDPRIDVAVRFALRNTTHRGKLERCPSVHGRDSFRRFVAT